MTAEQQEILKDLLAEYLLRFGHDCLHSSSTLPGEAAWIQAAEAKHPFINAGNIWIMLQETQRDR